ncbi:MAG: cbb3-type cytochrome c oxidase N-terminal domain-containing protein [Bacteroidia bacterium]
MKKTVLSFSILTAATTVFAADETGPKSYMAYNMLLGVILLLAAVLLVSVIYLQRSVNTLKKGMPSKPGHEELSGWEKLLLLKPLSLEKDQDLGHNYDGIRELDNPIPIWFNVLFYATIIFAVVYLLVYHVFGAMPLQEQEYKNELASAQIQKEEFIKKAGNQVDENNVTLVTDVTKLADAKKIFRERCVVCHGDNAEGKVGPNLTDEYWIHGGTVKDIFKTIKEGVPAKGMVSWQTVLKPTEIQLIASYVLSLQGSNPANAKAPQGDKITVMAAVPSDSAKKDTVRKK